MNDMVDISRHFPLTFFLSGVLFATFAASGLFYIKFWRKTHEWFFLCFALACWAIATERVAMLLETDKRETTAWVYLFRLAAFALVILSVVHANFKKKKEATA